MRLQLDSSPSGPVKPGESGQAAPVSGSGSDSRRPRRQSAIAQMRPRTGDEGVANTSGSEAPPLPLRRPAGQKH